MNAAVIRPARPEDEELLHRLIHRAWKWQQPWDEEEYATHRRTHGQDSYVTGFGRRPGDVGVVAEVGERSIGAAWCRLLTGSSARAGHLADDVPELAMAVVDDHRGRGIGTRLLTELITAAAAAGHQALSLHVDDGNVTARRIYQAAGFRPVARRSHGDGFRLWL